MILADVSIIRSTELWLNCQQDLADLSTEHLECTVAELSTW